MTRVGTDVASRLDLCLDRLTSGRFRREHWTFVETDVNTAFRKRLRDSMSGETQLSRLVKRLDIQSMPEFQFVMLEFLRGLMPGVEGISGPITRDTRETTLDTLIDINRLGLVTIDSQPGVCMIERIPGDLGFREHEQRPYVEGVMDLELAFALYCFLQSIRPLEFFMAITSKQRDSAVRLSGKHGKDIAAPQAMNVTRQRTATNRLDLTKTDWDDTMFVETHWNWFIEAMRTMAPRLVNRHDVAVVTIVGRDYCDTTLLPQIRDALEQIEAETRKKRQK